MKSGMNSWRRPWCSYGMAKVSLAFLTHASTRDDSSMGDQRQDCVRAVLGKHGQNVQHSLLWCCTYWSSSCVRPSRYASLQITYGQEEEALAPLDPLEISALLQV